MSLNPIKTKTAFWFTILLLTLSLFSQPAAAERYYTVPEALKYLFPTADKIGFTKHKLSKKTVSFIKKNLKLKKLRADWTLYRAQTKGKTSGYAIIDNVVGRELPITYIVSLEPSGTIKEIEILVYRESHGSQVKQSAYRKQFIGKSNQDKLQVGKDIRHVSSATISSKNIARGVKKVLAIFDALPKE